MICGQFGYAGEGNRCDRNSISARYAAWRGYFSVRNNHTVELGYWSNDRPYVRLQRLHSHYNSGLEQLPVSSGDYNCQGRNKTGPAGRRKTALSQRLDRLLQTTLRRTRVRPAVSRPLCPPRRHLQPPLGRIGNGQVTFRWRDSADHNRQKVMTVSRDEFLRRFLLHLLPKGFVRIRHFGFLANRRRAALLPRCFAALRATPAKNELKASTAPTAHPLWRCPKCGGPMVVIERFTAAQLQLRSPPLLVTAA